MLDPCFECISLLPFLFCNHLAEEAKCFTLIVFLLLCGCHFSESLPRCAIGCLWSKIPILYSLFLVISLNLGRISYFLQINYETMFDCN